MDRDWSATTDRSWRNPSSMNAATYRCGYCGRDVASKEGLSTYDRTAFIRICPQCNVPTFFSALDEQIPGAPPREAT